MNLSMKNLEAINWLTMLLVLGFGIRDINYIEN